MTTRDFRAIVQSIAEWQASTFPLATTEGARVHLEREVLEAAEELADVIFLARQAGDEERMAAATEAIRLLGLEPVDVLEAKLKKNKARRWPTEPDADGVYEHLEEAP